MLLPRPRGISFQIFRAGCLVTICLLIYSTTPAAETARSNVVCREEFPSKRRNELESKLRKITGWSDLSFDLKGTLRGGSKEPAGGSASARELVAQATAGPALVVLEDASKRSDVAFCQVLTRQGKGNKSAADPLSYVVLIDFEDFEHVMGDEQALDAFDVGWGFLHELDHIVNDSDDPAFRNETGECETHINQMRRECNLPQRTDYFYTLLPLTTDKVFMTRLVRLAFDQEQTASHKKKRYWVIWDANVVGGLDEQKQIAALR